MKLGPDPKMINKVKPTPNKLFSKVSTFSTVALLAAVIGSTVQTQAAHAAIIGTFEIESPGVQYNQFGQNNDGNGSVTVYNQTFNAGSSSTTTIGNQIFSSSAPTAGKVTSNYQWVANGTTIGSYNNIYARTADNFGGSIDPTSNSARSNYITVNPNSSLGGLTTSTLTLTQNQKYFGLWWSAGDVNNKLEFYNASNQLVGSFVSSDITAAIQKLSPNTQNSYKGNPTQSSKTNTGEYYAYLNFFATDTTTFNKVVFTNLRSTGFETDNHAVATSYNKIRGQNIAQAVPEPLTILGAATAVAFGASFKRHLANAKK
jgi:hypothetical protein